MWKKQYRYPIFLKKGLSLKAFCVRCGTKKRYTFIFYTWVIEADWFWSSVYIFVCVQCGRNNRNQNSFKKGLSSKAWTHSVYNVEPKMIYLYFFTLGALRLTDFGAVYKYLFVYNMEGKIESRIILRKVHLQRKGLILCTMWNHKWFTYIFYAWGFEADWFWSGV